MYRDVRTMTMPMPMRWGKYGTMMWTRVTMNMVVVVE